MISFRLIPRFYPSKFFDMSTSRKEFIRNSLLIAGAAGLNMPSRLYEKNYLSEEGNRLVLLGTQGGLLFAPIYIPLLPALLYIRTSPLLLILVMVQRLN